MASLVLGARIVLAGIFAVAGVAKLLDLPGSRRALVGFGVPGRAIPAFAVLLPLAELAIAAVLVPAGSARWGAVAALVLLLCFVAAIGRAMRGGGQAPDCHCFGQLHSAPAGWPTLGRNALLAALAAVVVADGPGPSVGGWTADRSAAELVAVATAAVAIALAAMALRLWHERTTLARDLADAQQRLGELPEGLPVGALAPDFSLPDLDGEVHTLTALRARGHPVVIVFVSQGCGPCQQMFPELGRWQRGLADRLTLAVITTGTVAENRATAREHGIVMLRQDEIEVMQAYKLSATPCALVVSADGMISTHTVGSRVAIEPLIRLTMRRDPTHVPTSGHVAIPPPAA
jgi:peroxiredoxin/uncharacterized membrane protein YphA (DoxX/SURF4 family)